MIAFIKGELVDVENNNIVIDCNGVGYNILMPSIDIPLLPNIGNETMVHTYFHVTDQGMSLFGFNSKKELGLFKKLISVNGLGPKGAISILGTLSYEAVCVALISGDAKLIATAPGVGKKIAERAIIDLRDKIDNIELSDDVVSKTINNNPFEDEVIEALISLGYSKQESKRAISSIVFEEGKSEEDIIKECLLKLL